MTNKGFYEPSAPEFQPLRSIEVGIPLLKIRLLEHVFSSFRGSTKYEKNTISVKAVHSIQLELSNLEFFKKIPTFISLS